MRIRHLTLMAAGITMVALDFRVVAVDLLPDALGWALVAWAGWALSMELPALLAAGAAVASVPQLVLPYRWEALDPLSGDVVEEVLPGRDYPERLVFESQRGLAATLAIIAVVLGGAALWWMLRALAGRARAIDDQPAATRLDWFRWGVALGCVAPFLAISTAELLAGDGIDPVWNEGRELVALVGIGILLALAWFLGVNANRGWTATERTRGAQASR